MKTRFNNTDGSLTRYAFNCGYIEQKENNQNRLSLSLDGVYHVKGFVGNQRVWESFEKLTDARKYYKSISIN
jgi:hypothetical protein